jgi:hypothetical protein
MLNRVPPASNVWYWNVQTAERPYSASIELAIWSRGIFTDAEQKRLLDLAGAVVLNGSKRVSSEVIQRVAASSSRAEVYEQLGTQGITRLAETAVGLSDWQQSINRLYGLGSMEAVELIAGGCRRYGRAINRFLGKGVDQRDPFQVCYALREAGRMCYPWLFLNVLLAAVEANPA